MTGFDATNWVDWLILVIRVTIVFFALLLSVLLTIWVERKVVADIQTRVGPNRAGPWGILVTLADGIKLFFKEGITPATADRRVYYLAPIVALVPAFLAFAVIPFGTSISLFGREIPLQLTDLNVGVLYVVAVTSLGVYGVVLAGWSSGTKYPLLGGVRSSAQMVSYEVSLGLGLVAVLMYAGTLQMSEIVAEQGGFFRVGDVPIFPRWNIVPQLPAFIIYGVSAMAESNRAPFDLPEAESELVAGFHTEYSGIRFAMFFLAEYLHMITVSAIAVTVFFGGWRGPIFGVLPWLWPPLWFLLKLVVVLFVFIWIRGTLPRFRYDRLMHMGWKVLIPFGLVWVVLTGVLVVLPDVVGRGRFLRWGAIFLAAVLLLSLIPSLFPRKREEEAPG